MTASPFSSPAAIPQRTASSTAATSPVRTANDFPPIPTPRRTSKSVTSAALAAASAAYTAAVTLKKMRSSDATAKLCEWLGVDGAIVSQEGFGNPDTDLIMNCRKIEAKGIKTVIITDEYAGRDGASQSLADADAAADAVVTGGNANMLITLPPMDKVIGYPEVADIIAGGFDGSLKEDGSIEAELQVITGATNEMGFNRLSAR